MSSVSAVTDGALDYEQQSWFMNTILKLLVPCRLALQVQQRATRLLPAQLHRVPPNLTYVGTRTMAQRSITSFFKATPPKPVVKEEKSDQDNGIVNSDNSPGSPENGKVSNHSQYICNVVLL